MFHTANSMASQARHEPVAQQSTCASRIVVPSLGGSGEGEDGCVSRFGFDVRITAGEKYRWSSRGFSRVFPPGAKKKLFLAEPETTFINICMTVKEKLNQSEHALFGRGSEKPDPTRKAVCEEDLKVE
jgi:hypothetical protein